MKHYTIGKDIAMQLTLFLIYGGKSSFDLQNSSSNKST